MQFADKSRSKLLSRCCESFVILLKFRYYYVRVQRSILPSSRRGRGGLSAFLEEFFYQCSALLGEHTGVDFCLWMQHIGCEDGVATLWVGCAVNESAYLCPGYSTGAHGARLHGNVECAVGEVFPAKASRCRGYGLHFGVCGNVVQPLCEVMRTGNYLIIANYDCSDWHLAVGKRILGLL